MDRNEAQGRAVLARGLASKELVYRAWQAAQGGGELLAVLVSWRVISEGQAAELRAALAPSALVRTLRLDEEAESSGRFSSVPPAGGGGLHEDGVATALEDESVPVSIGGHAILKELSRGGMGVVYKARHKSLGEEIALKVLLKSEAGEVDRLRFEREARAMFRLHHPNAVRLLDYGEDRGRPFLAMELIAGASLEQRVRDDFKGGPPLPWLLRVLRSIAEALKAGHALGLVHRDLKPSNVMIEAGTDRAVLIDFGLARASEGQQTRDGRSLTTSGSVMGTPSYMAPEQFDAREFGKVGPATDVWGFGGLIFFCLTGRAPFEGPTLSIYKNIVTGKRPKLGELCQPPPWLEEVFEGCFSLEPERRWSFDRILAELARAGQKKARRERSWLAVGLTAALMALGGLGLGLSLAERPPAWAEKPVIPRFIKDRSFRLQGRLNGPGLVRVERLEGAVWRGLGDIQAGRDGQVSRLFKDLPEGASQLRLMIEGDESPPRLLDIYCDSAPPRLSIDGLWRDFLSRSKAYKDEVTGRVDDESPCTVMVGGKSAVVAEDGRFAVTISLSPGEYLEFVVRDEAGNETSRRIKVVKRPRLDQCRAIQDLSYWKTASLKLRENVSELVLKVLGKGYRFAGFQKYRCGGEEHTIARYLYEPTKTVLHLIPGGVFAMGNPNPRGDYEYLAPIIKEYVDISRAGDWPNKLSNIDVRSFENEEPRHEVTVPAFLIGQTELSAGEWSAASGKPLIIGSQVLPPNYPVMFKSWTDIKAWLAQAGGGLRLPSEAEWEYACRAGTTTRYYWGDAMDDDYVYFWKNLRGRPFMPVTAHVGYENAFGLRDMCGNVSELCEDVSVGNYLEAPVDGRPRLEPVGENDRRVLRGGGRLLGGAQYARSSSRNSLGVSDLRNSVGFRVARSVPGFDLEKDG